MTQDTSLARWTRLEDAFTCQATLTPDAPAVLGHKRVQTYAELEAAAVSVAARLVEIGVQDGTMVGVRLQRSDALPAVLLGILKAGGAYLTLDPGHPHDRERFICGDARVSIIVVDDVSDDLLNASGVPNSMRIRLSDLFSGAKTERIVEPRRGTPESVAYVTYVSGFTGQPHGVAVSHRNILALTEDLPDLKLEGGTVTMQFSDFNLDTSTFEMWAPLLNGGCVAFPRADAAALDLPEEIERFSVSTIFLTTALFNELIDVDAGILADVSQVIIDGESISADRVSYFLNLREPGNKLLNCYSRAETTSIAAYAMISPHSVADGTVPIGHAVGAKSALVADENLRPVGPGAAGQLYMGGDGVALGYLGRPALTAEYFVPDPSEGAFGRRAYRSGDAVRRDQSGFLEFVGRLDRQVKVRGLRVEPAEVESALRMLAAVRDAIVLERVAEPGSSRLDAYVLQVDGVPLTEYDLKAALTTRLPDFMIPDRLVTVDRFPTTVDGQVDVVALTATGAKADMSTGVSRGPSTATERLLVDIWCSILDLPEVGVDDNFFEVGGDSILSIGIVAESEERGLKLTLVDLFELQTIAELASALDAAATAEGSQ